MPFDRKIYFDHVRDSLFGGSLEQGQVDGQEAILTAWETYLEHRDMRWLAYMLATTLHETASEMLPVEEYGKGAGKDYGEEDPETGQTYYGRGFVQLTWRDNYARSDREIAAAFNVDTTDENASEWHADLQLLPIRALLTMYLGMSQGWFRKDANGVQSLPRYFSDTIDDAYGAREIINGDKSIIPSWSNGVSIGELIRGYHKKFLAALEASEVAAPSPEPPPGPAQEVVEVAISIPQGVQLVLTVNGKEV